MAFELNDLPYSHDALEAAGMSKETLEFHHDLPVSYTHLTLPTMMSV